MITFSNGHQFQFVAASGALAYDGEGWWFEKLWRYLNVIRPKDFTIITKTLTFMPKVGNYVWHKPWKCFRFLEGGYVNAFGLTNPGYKWWLNRPYHHVKKKGYKVIVSIMPADVVEAKLMAIDLNDCDIAGVELNVSCPNHDAMSHICGMVETFCNFSKHPVVLKLGYDQPYLSICRELDTNSKVEAFDLINAVPWDTVFPRRTSPLEKHTKSKGGVSGRIIREFSRTALLEVKDKCMTPVISGGGIDTYDEMMWRANAGADAFSLGTVFIWKPWLPSRLVETWNGGK